MEISDIKATITAIEKAAKEEDYDTAHSLEDKLMKDYISYRRNIGDPIATEISKSWNIRFKRFYS